MVGIDTKLQFLSFFFYFILHKKSVENRIYCEFFIEKIILLAKDGNDEVRYDMMIIEAKLLIMALGFI